MRALTEESMAKEVCTFRYDHDPATLTPRGRACKRLAIHTIYWRDGRTSVACSLHGFDALADEAKNEVLRIIPMRPVESR